MTPVDQMKILNIIRGILMGTNNNMPDEWFNEIELLIYPPIKMKEPTREGKDIKVMKK